jgi:hypothetical protein
MILELSVRIGRATYSSEDQVFNTFWITVAPDVIANSKVLNRVDPIGLALAGVEHGEIMVLD